MKIVILVLKCVIVLVVTEFFFLFLAPQVSKLGVLISHLDSGLLGGWFYLILNGVMPQLISAVLCIGIFGGIWLKEYRWAGFILATISGLVKLIFVLRSGLFPLRFSIGTMIIYSVIPLTIIAGGITYIKVQKWRHKHTTRAGLAQA